MIETAIMIPFFIFLLIAIIDFGLYFNTKNVAQSAAWNGAKECVAGNSPIAIVQATLQPILSADDLSLVTPSCSTESAGGGATYSMTQVIVAGNMLSPFTTALGLYPITAVGIAN